MKRHSERVPGKNMKQLCGRPLFHWILDVLSQSKYIEEIIVNTDSEEIAKSATKNFIVTIHMRPYYLLNITSDEASKIIAYDLENTNGDYFIQTHSTNPLLMNITLDSAIEVFFQNQENDSLVSVTKQNKRFFWADGKPVNHDLKFMLKTQDMTPLYEENSCIYIFSRKSFFTNGSRIGSNPMFYPMRALESLDIDELLDFEIAEFLMKKRVIR